MDASIIIVILLPLNLSGMLLQQPWLVDTESNHEEAKLTLDALYDQLTECQKKVVEYRNYQKSFKVISYSLKELCETIYLFLVLRTLSYLCL
jgi:hypothetical protein